MDLGENTEGALARCVSCFPTAASLAVNWDGKQRTEELVCILWQFTSILEAAP